MVSCGAAAAIPGRQRSMGKISGFDVVDGSVRIYVRSMVGEPGRGLSGATTRTRYWSPSSAWHRDGWWACCVGGAGRDLRHVGSGLVQTGQLGGHFGTRRFAVGGLAGSGGCHGVVTSGAKHGGTEADALRRFLQISGRGGTGWDG
jgi:hypothetical protein